MKKGYINPNLEICVVKSLNILADSLENGGDGDGRPAQAKAKNEDIFESYSFDCDFDN